MLFGQPAVASVRFVERETTGGQGMKIREVYTTICSFVASDFWCFGLSSLGWPHNEKERGITA